jgi:hypothetical protein
MKNKQATIESITVERLPDDNADLSYLETKLEGKTIISSCQHTQEDMDKHPKRTMNYIKRDQERLASYGQSWEMIGIRASAEVSYPIGNGNNWLEHFTSGGLWGIESDSDESYLKEIEQEQLNDLKSHLEQFNVNVKDFDSKIS